MAPSQYVSPAGLGLVKGRPDEFASAASPGFVWRPRILAAAVADLGASTLPAPLALIGEPSVDLEWRLVRVAGEVRTVHGDGAQWRAEVGPMLGAGAPMRSIAFAGAVPADRLTVGAIVTIVGIVRRPYPTATDRRFSILPRSSADLAVKSGPAAPSSNSTSTDRPAPTPAQSAGGRRRVAPSDRRPGTGAGRTSSSGPGATTILDVDLVDLGHVVGLRVRVGGIIVGMAEDGFVLDDGTAQVTVHLGGDAAIVPGPGSPSASR